jgi:hypothetical protein
MTMTAAPVTAHDASDGLAGDALHDLCNALTIVQAYAELLADDAQVDSRLRPRLVSMREAAGRASEIARYIIESTPPPEPSSDIIGTAGSTVY